MARKSQLFRVMPWVGGINTSVDPGVLNPQELVQADNVKFSASGARIKREAFEYLDNEIFNPDFRSSSGTTRTLKWTTHPLVNILSPDQRLVTGELINVAGTTNYAATSKPILSVTNISEVTNIICVADVSGSLAGKYFLLSGGDQGTNFYIWFKVSGVGTDPQITGRIGIEVDFSTNASAGTVRSAISTSLVAHPEFTTGFTGGAQLDVTHVDPGYTVDASAGTSGFTVSVSTQGGTAVTYEGPSSLSESSTAAGVSVNRASAVIWTQDYWHFDDSSNVQMLVYATADFQLFKLDDSGRRTQILGQTQVTNIVTAAASTLTTGDYFLLNGPGNEINYYVWFNKAGGGGNPLIPGRTGIEVDVGGGDTDAQVATAAASAIDALADFQASSTTNVLVITNARAGITDNTVDASVGGTGFTITTTSYGATLPATQLETVRMVSFNERLLIFFSGLGNFPVKFNPEESDKYQLVVANLPDVGIQMPDASFAFIHLGRVWTNDKSNPDEVHYSETFDETLWLGLGDSGALPVAQGDGDPGGIVNGYAYKGFVVISKKDSRHRVDGDSPENFLVTQLSRGMGNEGAMYVPVDEMDIVFMSRRGIHSQQATDQYGDTDSMYVSSDIKPSFLSFNAETLKFSQGTYIPELNSIALSITEGGKQSADDIWLYNIEIQAQGKNKPGAWYRWPGISCTALNRQLASGIHKIIVGTKNGRVARAQKANNFTDFGTDAIEFKIKTGTIYPNNDPQSMKLFKKLTMFYRPKGNFSFSVEAKVDNHVTQGFSFDQISGLDLLGETFTLGTSLLGASAILAPFTFTMDGHGRGVTLTVTQPNMDETVEIWSYALEYDSADLEQETV